MFGLGKIKKTVHVEKPGTLHLLISEKEKYSVSELTISGDLNGADLLMLREMAGYNANMSGEKSKGSLYRLDLKNARFVPSDDKYARTKEDFCVITKENVIPERAFRKCVKLRVVILPDNATSIEPHAFERCSHLTSVTINEGVETIGSRAFRKCTELKTITFPSTVKLIEKEAFSEDENIGKMFIHAEVPPTIFVTTFYALALREVKITIPQGSLQAYKKNISWRKFMNFKEE